MLTNDIDKAEVLVVLDIHNFMLRCYYAKGFAANAKNKQGYPTGHIYLAFQKVRAALNEFGLKKNIKTCLVLSAQENSGVRRKLYPQYKMNREKREYESYEVTDPEGEIVDRTCDPVLDGMEFLQCFPCVNLEIVNGDGETDDAIAALKRKYGKSKTIYIITEDRDVWSLISDTVHVVSKPGVAYTKQHLFDSYGISDPRKLQLVKAVLGDSSDNIDNTPGFSHDTYSKVVVGKDTKSHYFSLHEAFEKAKRRKGYYSESLFEHIKKINNKKLNSLLEHAEEIRKREAVVRLRSKIEIRYNKLQANPSKLKRLLEWYAIKKDFASAVALATVSKI